MKLGWSGLHVLFPRRETLTHQRKLEGNCPGDTKADEAPDKDLERTINENPFVKQKDADFVHAEARPYQ